MFRSMSVLTMVVPLISVMAGCAAEPVGPGGEVPDLTKDEARTMQGKSDHWDFCDLFGWYDDDVCDEFCPSPDPDCEPEAECRTNSDCPTIYCVRAPCPENTCVAGECVIDNPVDACPAGERECARCGGDVLCIPHGESCPRLFCPPPSRSCGGLIGGLCGEGQYCEYDEDAGCGFADATGTCQDIPTGCPRHFDPVCGCNGETYPNACNANAAGVSVASRGECEARGCVVGGCSGQLCGEEGESLISTCEWRPEYACYDAATCERQSDGACGWTETPTFTECLSGADCRTVLCSPGTMCQMCDGAPACLGEGESC